MTDTLTVEGGRGGVDLVVAGLMWLAAATLALASIVHFGVVIPLGFVTINDPFAGARIPEAIIAGVLAAGASGIPLRWRGGWGLALGTVLFAIAGVILGLTIVLFGSVSRPGDLVYHAGLMLLLLVALLVLLLPQARHTLPRRRRS